MQNSHHIEEEGQHRHRRRRRRHRRDDGTSISRTTTTTPVRNNSSTCHLMRCCCSVLLLPMGSAFQLRQLPHGSSQSSQLYLPLRHANTRRREHDAQYVPVPSAGIIMGVARPSSARSSGVGMTDRIQQTTALSMNSPSDHNDNDDDKVKKKRKPTKLSRIKTSRSIQNVYWTLCPAARYDRGNNGNSGKNKKNRRKRNDTNTNARTSTDLSHTTHPLLAAAALRRVADLRALGMTYRLRRQRGQARPSASKEIGRAHV